jgi:alanine racemase
MWTDPPPDIALRPTVATVDLGALGHNVRVVRARVGPRPIMAIVKANAYGHGLLATTRALLAAGVEELGVAFLEEGVWLRRNGVEAPILVLGGIIGNQIQHFVEHALDMTASSPMKLAQIDEVAGALGRRARVHLKIDTGMGRIGVQWDRAEKLVDAVLAARHVDVVGLFTHFASSDAATPEGALRQRARLDDALSRLRRRGLTIPRVHTSNSGALLHPDLPVDDLVRPGALLYGFSPAPTAPRTLAVRPVLSLHTRVVYFKVLRQGSPVSYDGTWVAPRDTRVVTLPVGYGDGYLRALSNRAEVLIGGARRRQIGNITMDAMMVELGEGSAYNGDEVVLIGRQGDEEIRVEELAARAGTIPYEILTSINLRVPRRYVGDPRGAS